jgi:hypothetical protein
VIRPTKIRELLLAKPTSEKRPSHLAAASGLVHVNNTLYVVADDEHHLGVFPANTADRAPGDLIRLFEGKLPEKTKKRKAEKPDLETLTMLPVFAGHPHGALLALGSGSKPNREIAVLLSLDATGCAQSPPIQIDFGDVYDGLRNELEALNIEGAVISGGSFFLLQRGNKGSANALIKCDLQDLLHDLAANKTPRLHRAPSIKTVNLGEADDVPLCFTDGATLGNGTILFTAVAEDTDNSIDDGAFKGAVIGLIDANGKIARMEPLAPAYKVEGVTAEVAGGAIHVRLVTDGDDASKAAWLLAAELHW